MHDEAKYPSSLVDRERAKNNSREVFELKKFGFAVWSDVQAGAAITGAIFSGNFVALGLGSHSEIPEIIDEVR
ncbi:hypothetical protein M2262_001327 [Pseudomonas sp. BIGb0408]|uniref:Uncharacterized protein n=1 Tax=Phytopseudomonas flavescens TaxID=29435 RepID=A0A7Z0BP02_9GAMM|nr:MULTISPECIES: hypothetical protein [Pseudomonas]MCW2291277.1 hypothetical protein [Pseudomonas sp. BIGb0408]NYH74152.1 hypothetical protein [Pseudomonas flavescens]